MTTPHPPAPFSHHLTPEVRASIAAHEAVARRQREADTEQEEAA